MIDFEDFWSFHNDYFQDMFLILNIKNNRPSTFIQNVKEATLTVGAA